VLVDHYEDDWTKLWWVRVDGSARIVIDGSEFDRAIALLTERYTQYRSARPDGPAVVITIERMTGWSAS
jgi:PPOX class probable F420-dependent enzyme